MLIPRNGILITYFYTQEIKIYKTTVKCFVSVRLFPVSP